MEFEFYKHNAIVVRDGPHRGWVGYAQGNEKDGYVPVRLFASDGEISCVDELPIEYVKNVQTELKPSWDY